MISMAKHEWSLDELRSKAEAYCAKAEHCSSELIIKLQQWGASSLQCDDIVNYLQKHGYINEERYCLAFTHDKVLYQGWGRIKIKSALIAKHLPQNAISKALETIDKNDYFNTLRRIIKTKKRSFKNNDPQAREKLIRFCTQRGFTYDEIENLV